MKTWTMNGTHHAVAGEEIDFEAEVERAQWRVKNGRKALTDAEYDAIVPHSRDPYGPAFFKFIELDHGWSSEMFGHVLWLLYQPRTVIEFGCGCGGTLAALKSHGTAVLGMDVSVAAAPLIARRDQQIADEMLVHDLAEPWQWVEEGPDFDLAISVEVLEHVTEAGADQAVKTIAAAAPRAIVTACPPVGRNSLHLNEQPFGYWVDKFAAAGMDLDDKETAELKAIMRSFANIERLPVVPTWYFAGYIGVFRWRS